MPTPSTTLAGLARLVSLSAWLVLLMHATGEAQGQSNAAETGRKQASAVRVAEGAIRVDGRLDDPAWQQVPAVTDFIQKEPIEGAPPTDAMQVRFAYGNRDLYIGARMHSGDGSRIQAPMGRRDGGTAQAEHILIVLDTFLDRRTAYAFGVSASGVRLDRFYPQDDETTFDDGFDPVWQAATSVDETGWTAELRIPFSQLRFNDRAEHVWGLNVYRFVPTLNEHVYWTPVPRTQRAWASHFGDLTGIHSIRGTRPTELLPYVASGSTLTGDRDLNNPFDDGRNLTGRVGADLKMGIGPNLTLQATVNPDFGQVEADPAEVNLSANETFFTEKRPFFTEGSQLLTLRALDNFFYSRRVGARPTASVSGDYIDYPQASTILAAAKLTGRLRSGTSLGILGAVTAEESARSSNRESPLIETIRVAPRTTYGLAVLTQELGSSGSLFRLGASGVHRDVESGDRLAALLARSGFSVAGESLLRFKGGQYELETFGLVTYVQGEAAAIERIQRSVVHYLQRPDKDYAPFDPTRTSLSGYKAGGMFQRRGGRHWLWSVHTAAESPGVEPNDIGRMSSADSFVFDGSLRYRETQPGRIFRNYSIGVQHLDEWTYGGDRMISWVTPSVDLTWSNFWTTEISASLDFAPVDPRLTRGGPLMGTPRGWTTRVELGNSTAAQTAWSAELAAGGDEGGGLTRTVAGSLSFRPGPRWEVSVRPVYSHEINSQQYVTTLDGGRRAAFGRRYVFSFIDRSTLSTAIRLNYAFRPDVTLDVYAEPFAASGRYYGAGELSAPGARLLLVYGTSGTTVSRQPDGSQIVSDGSATFTLRNNDFNVRSFRSNVVLRWEWRPGSTLYAVWQQDRRASELIADRVGVTDLFGSFGAPGTNAFVVKTSFWLAVR